MRADRIAAALLALGALLYLLPLRAYGLAVSDDGWWLVPVLRMREGAILYRDLWTYYAPLSLHVFGWLFQLTDPSVLTARTGMAVEIAGAAVLAYRFTRRFAPPRLAWLPGAVYAFVPGPWHKAFYALVSIAFLVLLARAFEHPRARRFALLGAMAAVTLATRQDLGIAQLGIALVAAVLAPRFSTEASRPGLAPLLGATLASFVAVVAPFACYYGVNGALADLVEAVFVRAVAQGDAFPPALPALVSLDGVEGRGVALLMLVPLALAFAFGIGLLLRLRRRGLDAEVALRGALLAFACATLSQAYHPVLLVRLLQSALCFYVLATILLADAAAQRNGRTRLVLEAGGAGVAAFYVLFILFGVAKVHPGDLYTGSLRMRSYATPVELLGDTLFTGASQADEIRLVRAFFASHTRPDEPIVALPFHLLYYALVDRPNAIRFLADHAHGNFVMTLAQKREEADRLAASEVRYAIAEQQWFASVRPDDPFRNLLATQFRPVRGYHSLLIFERVEAASAETLTAILRRMTLGTPRVDDLASLRALADADPTQPLVWKLRGVRAAGAGEIDEAIEALHRAATLDPADATPLERSAALLRQQGRAAEAAADLQRARAIRGIPGPRDLAAERAGGARPQ